MKSIPLLLLLIFSLALSSCVSHPEVQPSKPHQLVGAWKATDNTVFIFRDDGTFHGVDFRKHEIWGNWVTLSDQRIGFQSLKHTNYYRPQYAVISADSNKMDYIISDGNSFIPAIRITTQEAKSLMDTVLAGKIIFPKKAARASHPPQAP